MTAAVRDIAAPMPHRIAKVKKETHDTITLEALPSDHQGVCSFAAGQFNMLYVYGIGEVPISISGDPADGSKIVHTIRAYGTVTNRMLALKRGDWIGLRGPFGRPWPADALTGQDILLIAGGIGIAPLRPVLYQILATRRKYGKVALLYGERTPGDLIYRSQIERWRGRFDLEVEVTVDSAREGWHGNVGVVTKLIPEIRLDPLHSTALICGPEIMMDFTIQALRKKGMEEDQIYISMERNMKCGTGFCGHCQLGPLFACKDGPVFHFSEIKSFFRKREL